METKDWFMTGPDRLSFFVVHWAQGKRLVVPYAAVTYMAMEPGERFVIMALGLKIEGRLGGGRERARRELEMATAALTGGKSYLSEVPSGGGEASTASAQPDPDNVLARSLENFQDAFQQTKLLRLFHRPDAQVRVQVYQRSEDDWEDFAF